MAGKDEAVDADAAVVEGQAPPSARVPLSRERIVDAAVAFIDEHGLPSLTMRRLGEELGVEAMALYRYVPGREDLLDAVVGQIIEQMQRDDDVVDAPQHGWQDFLQRMAHGVRRIALDHPRVFPLVASRPPEAPWLRPPLRSLVWVETFLQGLRQEGFSNDAAVAAYRAFTSFLLGHLLLEVAVHGADVGPLDVLEDAEVPAGSELALYPAVEELRSALSEDRSAVEFEDSLEELLNRIALIASENPSD
ncbi:TetR/AcrR family transcriptional regulator C-terminal domain-containing protein [Nocardioides sp. URHA0020]|uniref:TetR/AcrR family transcriptional regulator C-terminal domain-containing protein n=1 Tax=Nocardioides sp. URHA0020 TaxID=1380392 RepID=UPI000B201816|nr:TetR/AcrR family transcriptional regulator C-terminal domain-containing protein [Nocardioides sp. URHA0020]